MVILGFLGLLLALGVCCSLVENGVNTRDW